ncbi:actin depolymerizing protein [Panus rudis PR-1116 ss-1]|nr:actin depolymerizing protein [Panus rudis PR-1116 ss-1]
MSATSGITVSSELSSAFGDAVDSKSVRFLKIGIRNAHLAAISESLVLENKVAPSGSVEQDLDTLGDILEDNVPAYVLVRLDDPPTEWLAVFYVPDSAKVRDKMLYASTRTNLTKALGSTIKDSIFATSKDDVTSDAYRKHKAHLAAPKPMSAREKELEAVRAAELATVGRNYDEIRAKQPAASAVGFKWTEEVEGAIRELGSGEGSRLLVLTVEPSTETLLLSSAVDVSVNDVGSSLPASEPSYALFAWPHSARREVVFIYSCPSSSPVKHRMLYSCGTLSVYRSAKELLGDSVPLVERKVETSDPKEIDEAFLKSELGLTGSGGSSNHGNGQSTPLPPSTNAFARPKGPARRR